MKISKICFIFFGLLVLSGCYGSPAFDGDLEVIKEGQDDSGSVEPCVGEYGKAVLSWASSDPRVNAEPENKYTLKFGVESGIYPQEIDLPATGGTEFDTTYENESGDTVAITKKRYSYTLDNIERGYTYYFVVTASNDAGESLPSKEVFKKFVICPKQNDDLNLIF